MRRMKILLPVVFLSILSGVAPAIAGIKTVTQLPTVESMQPGTAVLYNDGHCPSGQIAKFVRAAKKAEIKKLCVHQN